MERIVFVGPGRVGLALGGALLESGEVEELLYHGRRPVSPDHPIFDDGHARYEYGLERPAPGTTALFLTVPDDVLPELAHALAARGEAPSGCAVFHTSGALGTEILEPLHLRGYAVGSLHPLKSVANPVAGREGWEGVYFALSGEPDALRTGERLLRLIGGRALTIPTTRRPLYHAAAAMASNHLVFLIQEAIELLRTAGAQEEQEAADAILALARGTLENIQQLGTERALTGPLARGDVETIALHLRSLPAEVVPLYATLARRGLAWRRSTLPPDIVDRLEELLSRQEKRRETLR